MANPSDDIGCEPAEPADTSITYHTREGFSIWEAIQQLTTELALSWRQVASDELSRYRLWASNIGAYHDPCDQRSADYRLRGAPDFGKRIVQLLEELNEALDDIYQISSGQREGETEEISDPHSNAQDSPRTEISELWLMVEEIMTNLMKVSVLVRKSTKRNRFQHAIRAAAKVASPSVPTTWDVDHIRHKHPKLERNRWLLDRVGEANTQRRQFLLYAQDHGRRVAFDQFGDFGSKSLFSRPTQALTQATTVVKDEKISSALAHLDYEGNDDASATSLTTYATGRDDDGSTTRLRIVSLITVCPEGKPGLCPYCQGMVLFTGRKLWRRHVFSDLMAYTCTFEHCNQRPFESYSAWATHEKMEHRRQWHCPSCDGVFGTRTSTEDHLATEHPSINTSLYGDLIEAASQHVQILEDPQCLFCDESGLWDQSTGTAPKLDLHASKNQSVSTNSFRRHVGRHLEQIALFAVPSTVQDTEADDVNSTASQDTYREIEFTSRIDSIAVGLDRDGAAGDRSSEDGTVSRQIPGPRTDISTSSPSTLSQGVTDVAAGESSERPNLKSHTLSEDRRSRPTLRNFGDPPPPRSEDSTPGVGIVSRSSSDALRDRLVAIEARAGPPGDDSPTRRSNTPPLAVSGTNSRPRSYSQMFQPSHPSEIPSGSSLGTSSGDDDQLDGHVQKNSSFERLDGRKVKEHNSSDHPVATGKVKSESILIDQYGDNVLNDFDVHPSFRSNRLETDRPTPSDDVTNTVATSESPGDAVQLISDERHPEDQFDRKGSPELDSADQTTDTSLGKRSPGLNLLPSLHRRRTDNAQDLTPRIVSPNTSEGEEYANRGAVRPQKASDEAVLRRQEDLEAAENRLLDLEAGRAEYPRSTHRESDGRERPSPLLHSSQRTPKFVIDGRKFYDDTREEAESRALRLDQEPIATEDRDKANIGVEAGGQYWKPFFDDSGEQHRSGGGFNDVSEGSTRQDIERRREDDSPRRNENTSRTARAQISHSLGERNILDDPPDPQEAVAAEDTRARVIVTIGSLPVDITELRLDKGYLETLPEHLQESVIKDRFAVMRIHERSEARYTSKGASEVTNVAIPGQSAPSNSGPSPQDPSHDPRHIRITGSHNLGKPGSERPLETGEGNPTVPLLVGGLKSIHSPEFEKSSKQKVDGSRMLAGGDVGRPERAKGLWVCCECRNTNNPSHCPTWCPTDGHYKCGNCYVYH